MTSLQDNPSNLTKSLSKNTKIIQEKLNNTAEFTTRNIQIEGHNYKIHYGALIYLDGIVNTQTIRESIIQPLAKVKRIPKEVFIKTLACQYITAESAEEISGIDQVVDEIVKGKTLLIVDGFEVGIIVDTSDWKARTVEKSFRQRSPSGPQIGLNEMFKTNLNIIRSYIKSPELVVEMKKIGRYVQEDVAIVYLKSKVDQLCLEEVREKIDSIDVEYALEGRIIDDALEGNRPTLFPLTKTEEMPDVIATALYEGRIAIFIDGTPEATVVPALFVQFMQVPNSYYEKTGRFADKPLFFISFFLSFLLPGVYMALQKYHTDWFPKKAVKIFFEDLVGFTPFWDMIFLIFILYLISMAAFRISGDMIIVASLLGTTVISSTVVQSKMIHPMSIVVVGTAVLISLLFMFGGMGAPLLPLRIIFLIIGDWFGFTGMGIGLVILIIYMSRLRSLGVPYLAPIIPFHPKEFKDVIFRGKLKNLLNSVHRYPHDKKQKK